MPRKKLTYFAGGLYHVRARSNNKEWFYVPMEVLWKIFLEYLHEVSIRYHAHLISFVLMSNHFHLIVETPEGNLGEIMNYLQREVSRSVGSISGRINHVFGGTYKGTLIGNEFYLYNVYRYVYQNPLAAGLCERVEQYEFSTLRYLMEGKSPIAIADYLACKRAPIPNPIPQRLQWLNVPLSSDQRDLIRRGLRKAEFEFPKKYVLRPLIKSLKFDADGFPGK